MKHAKTILAGAIMLLAMAMPSISAAQYPDQNLNGFLDQHQKIKSYLVRNPNLIYDKQFRHEHPQLQIWMQQHPNVWGKLPGADRWGAYGPDHSWHEADWWHQHDPDWMNKNHPEWAENHPDWRGDGDYDEHHEWHARQWWSDHRPDWVQKHHPDWYNKHEQHEAAKEEQHTEKVHEQEGQSANPQKHEHHGNNGDHNHN